MTMHQYSDTNRVVLARSSPYLYIGLLRGFCAIFIIRTLFSWEVESYSTCLVGDIA